MARGRQKPLGLRRLLETAAQPIYGLDQRRTVIFCNQALLNWTGCSAEELLGKTCAYHSEPSASKGERVAADLCPPPEALAGRETTGTVARSTPEGDVVYRRAAFVPLHGEEGSLLGVLVVVSPEDQGREEVSAGAASAQEPSEAEWLHERLRVFHRQASARLRADRLVGQSAAMRRVRAQVAVASQTSASVLLWGPAGSGRQRIAAAIHYGTDPASSGSLIPLACSVLGAELIRSTVSALASKKLSEQKPPGDSLLLNDVDALPTEIQGPLAELFSSEAWKLRLLATARQPLEELVRQGKYHHDLAMLLSTIVIQVPALSERREDIPLLAQLFLEQCNAQGTKQLAGFTPEAMDALCAYPWPGNADELAQMVREAYGRAQSLQIGVADLPARIHLAEAAAAYPRRVDETIVLGEYLRRVECELITRALRRAKGNKAKAARLLGITRPRLYRRLVQLGLGGEE